MAYDNPVNLAARRVSTTDAARWTLWKSAGSVPANEPTAAERARVLAVLRSSEFVDRLPLTVWPTSA